MALSVAHFLSPVSRRLSADRDVELALLDPERPMVFVYHPGPATVDAIRLPKKAARGAGSAVQRAHGLVSLVLKRDAGIQAPVFYLEAPYRDLESFSGALNGWRGRPAYFFSMAAWLGALKKAEGTNLSRHDLALLFLELTRLDSSSFNIADLPGDFSRAGAGAEPAPGEADAEGLEPPGVRLEVLNASGRRELAERVTRRLRKKGFDVINFGNYGAVEKQTKIVNCSGNIAAARLVREALGLTDLEIYSKPEKPAVVHARVILGTDFLAAGTADPAGPGKEGGR